MSVPTTANNRAIALVYATIFLDVLGLGVLIPVLPYYARQYSADAATVGFLSVSFSLALFISSPILGALSDRIGRRPVILWNILGSSIAYFLFGWANTLWLLMVARLIEGITGGSISSAQAYIADVTPPAERMKRFGFIGAVFGLGFILGPAFGGFLSRYGLSAPAYAAGTLCFIAFLFGFFMLPESLPAERRVATPMSAADFNPFTKIQAALSRDSIRAILVAMFLVNVAFSGLQSNFAVLTLNRFQMGPSDNALIFVYIGMLSILMQGVVVRRLPKSWNPVRTCMTGLTAMALGFLGIAFAAEKWHLFPAIAVMAFGNGITAPMLTALISRRVGEREQGTVLGSSQGIISATRIVGPLYAGYAFDWFGSGSPYWIGALMAIASVFVIRLMPEAAPEHTQTHAQSAS